MRHNDDNQPERRARLRVSTAGGVRRRLHDFRDQMTELLFAAEIGDRQLRDHLKDDLVASYAAVLAERES